MMISGGALGHAQALINPVLYGVCWRRYLFEPYAESDGAKVLEPAMKVGAAEGGA